MKVIGFCGYSGAGKTTLVEQLIVRLRRAGQRVSVVKHAHHAFDIDVAGKDSWRHRQAGAFEVVIASNRRLAKIREFETHTEPTVHQLLGELTECDWVLVEGFKHAALPKIEIWRAEVGKPARYLTDPHVVAIATDDFLALPAPSDLPLLDLSNPDAVVDYLLQHQSQFAYAPPADSLPLGVVGGSDPRLMPGAVVKSDSPFK